jgi:hypothetical protein
MDHELKKMIADRFTPAELIELLDIDTYDVLSAVEDFNGFIIDEDTIDDIKEIMGVGDDTIDN